MPNQMYFSFVRLGVLAVVALTLALTATVSQAGGGGSSDDDDKPTVAECRDAWGDSDASGPCTLIGNSVTDDGKCSLRASCPRTTRSGSSATTTSWTGALEDVDNLVACNGILRLNSC